MMVTGLPVGLAYSTWYSTQRSLSVRKDTMNHDHVLSPSIRPCVGFCALGIVGTICHPDIVNRWHPIGSEDRRP
jgi:hypothetical protein